MLTKICLGYVHCVARRLDGTSDHRRYFEAPPRRPGRIVWARVASTPAGAAGRRASGL